MSALSLRLPDSIHKHIKEIAEKISAIMTEDYLNSRANKASLRDFDRILKKVPARDPLPGDEM